MPYTHHDRHSMRSYNGLYPGRTTPRSTSPYSSQVDLADVHPEHFTDVLAVPGRTPSVRSAASIKDEPWENPTMPPDEEVMTPGVDVVIPGAEEVVPFAPFDVLELKYYRTEYL